MRPATLVVALALAAGPAPAAPFEVGVDARVTSRAVAERNLPNSSLLYDDAARAWAPASYLALREARVYPVLAASASVSATFEPWLLAVVTLDPGVLTVAPEHLDTTTRAGLPALATGSARRWRLDGLAPAEALRQGWGLREAWVEVGLGPDEAVEVSLGKRRWAVLDGLVYDDYGLGASLRADLAPLGWPLALEARGLLTHRYWTSKLVDTPLADARATLEWAPGDRVTAGVTLAWDRTGFVPRLIASGAVESFVAAGSLEKALVLSLASPKGHSTLGWADLGVGLTAGPVEVALSGVVQWGATSFRFPGSGGGGSRLDLPGLALKADVRWEVASRLELSAFGLWLTGGRATTDSGALAGTYPVFVSLVPFLPYCSLFFDGGLAANLATREASLVGVSGRGVAGGGVTAALAWPEALGWRVTVAALGSDAPAPFTNGRFYGAEVDLELVWAALAWLDVTAEVAVLTPGTFYRDERTMLRATVGFDARY
jgi:hypothetical protein